MVTVLAASLLGTLAMAKAPRLSLTIDRIECLSESSDGIGSDEVYLVAITHELTGNVFRNHTSRVFEDVDSGEGRTLALSLKGGAWNPESVIFVVGLGECDNYDETGSWVMGYHHPRGLQCDTNTWPYIAADIAVDGLMKMARDANTAAMWQNNGLRGFRVQYIKTELAKALEDSRNDCLGVGEIVLAKADLEKARKYPGKAVSIVLTLKGDDAAYRVLCSLKAPK